MSKAACWLGIDTSCYTTSVALCGSAAAGDFFHRRRLLAVPAGARGLMQSEGVFQHITHLPALMEALLSEHPARIVGVCASVRPRPDAGSYMPVFRVGEGVARAVAASLAVPFCETTHQEGHIRAARVGTALDAEQPFLAIHLSGGTTEVLHVRQGALALLGGSADLHAGQLIDRVGVAMGLPFPAGPSLEALAARGAAESGLSTSVKGLRCSFSGAEAQAMRWLRAGEMPRERIAAEVFSCVARTVARLLVAAAAQTGCHQALLGGGVISSRLIREEITARVAGRNRNLRLHFSQSELAGDNAVGVALIGREWHDQRKGRNTDGGTED